MHGVKEEFGFSIKFCCAIFLLCLCNTLITTNFDILKYIKKYLKYQSNILLMFNKE